jgi:hypothetical protein
MDKISKLTALVIFSCLRISNGAEYDIKTITTIMDACEKQIDSIKLKYRYESPVNDKEGNREFVKGTFAQKKSEGYVLLDEIQQKGKTWDNDKEPEGIVRSYNGKITRYFEHEKNDRGHHMAALYEDHNPKLYKSRGNPYYNIWRPNYKNNTFSDKLNDPNSRAKIQGEELVDGLKTININFKEADGILDCHLWLLPDKNYLPKKLIVYHKKYKEAKHPLVVTHWSEFKEFPGGIWYPMNIKKYIRHLKVPTIFKTEEVDFSPLTKEDFEFKFPAFTHVTDHINGISYVTTTPLEQSGIEQTSLESSLSNEEKEEVLDKYLESGETNNSKDSNVIDSQVKLISQANLKEKSNEVPYWIIMLAFIFVGFGIFFVFTRTKKARKRFMHFFSHLLIS